MSLTLFINLPVTWSSSLLLNLCLNKSWACRKALLVSKVKLFFLCAQLRSGIILILKLFPSLYNVLWDRIRLEKFWTYKVYQKNNSETEIFMQISIYIIFRIFSVRNKFTKMISKFIERIIGFRFHFWNVINRFYNTFHIRNIVINLNKKKLLFLNSICLIRYILFYTT